MSHPLSRAVLSMQNRVLSSICRFLLMQGKGLGTVPHLCGVSLFVLFCSAFNSLLGLYLLKISYSVGVKFPAMLLLWFTSISTCGNSTVLLVSPSVKVSPAEIFVAVVGANTYPIAR